MLFLLAPPTIQRIPGTASWRKEEIMRYVSRCLSEIRCLTLLPLGARIRTLKVFSNLVRLGLRGTDDI